MLLVCHTCKESNWQGRLWFQYQQRYDQRKVYRCFKVDLRETKREEDVDDIVRVVLDEGDWEIGWWGNSDSRGSDDGKVRGAVFFK